MNQPLESKLYYVFPSPLGEILVSGGEEAIHSVGLQSSRSPLVPGRDWRESEVAFLEAKEQLDAYFAGELTEFSLRLEVRGTPFQRQVWKALRLIPYGTTVTYACLAETLGKPGAARAVGAACGANPIPIIIPCHRVVGASGELTGYRGGIELKRHLIELERQHLPMGQ